MPESTEEFKAMLAKYDSASALLGKLPAEVLTALQAGKSFADATAKPITTEAALNHIESCLQKFKDAPTAVVGGETAVVAARLMKYQAEDMSKFPTSLQSASKVQLAEKVVAFETAELNSMLQRAKAVKSDFALPTTLNTREEKMTYLQALVPELEKLNVGQKTKLQASSSTDATEEQLKTTLQGMGFNGNLDDLVKQIASGGRT